MGVGTQQLDFAEFYRGAADECLRTVVVSIGDRDTARELVDEAFARAWASWRTPRLGPAPSSAPSVPAGITGPLAVGLVYASPQCTG
jgi:DNA-directed RNA polymerase specialized sigma24 family protein